MKTMKFLSMAALALVGAAMTGCTNDDNIIGQPQQPEVVKGNTVTLTTTVGIGGGAETRALTAEGVKTFAAGETMALVYKNTSGETAVAVSEALQGGDITNEGKSATFTFTLDSPDKGQNVTYIYPAAMVNNDGSVKNDALAEQDGTLASLANNLDYCTNSGAWTNGTDLPSLTLDNQFAILALTLKNGAGSREITSSITGLTVSDGTNSYTVSRSAADGPIYVAIRPTNAALEITATATGAKEYTKTTTSREYAASNGYTLSLRMLTKVTWSESELKSMPSIWSQNGTSSLEGITLKKTSSEGSYYNYYDEGKYFLGEFQFSTVLGNITKIEVTTTEGSVDGWTNNVWTGNSSTVNFEGYFNATNIIFTIAEEDVVVSGISLNKNALELQVGGNETLTATISPDEATDKSVTWTSSNTSVATVDASGVVTAVATGEATIKATASNGLYAECTVTVTAAALNPLVIKDSFGEDGPTIYYVSGETWSQAINNHSENQSAAGRWYIDNDTEYIMYEVYGDYPYVKGILAAPYFAPINPNSVINPSEPSYYEWMQ